ncbi:Xaa-Pro peptidase family protein [uncultured Microbacterium sp.]|uniref:Peptidase M24 n=1 Tax=uncultured Microbacterium sp. TaxID=191216 RepID=A0A1Y5P3Z7_9MICO|nr:M24 family metallopeptidase [uncultured Microbacterium sp.]SBS72250.1 Peptidase M24 [uncultured Microbacterium sp.]
MPLSAADRLVKQSRLAAVRASAHADALLLTSHEALAWYLDGPRTHVSLAGPPVLAVVAADDGDTLFVAANEADRLIAEELLPADADRVVRVPWQTPPAAAAAIARAAIPEADVAPALRAARASLLPAEADRYRALGRDTAAALTDAATMLRPENTERDAAAALAELLVGRGIDPLVVLVAGRARLAHRHPLPTDGPLGERAMLVVCGRRHGLIANATRWVGAPGADDGRILEVEAAFLAATRPGMRLDEAFAGGCAGYAAAGFDEDEWRRHHQGGPTGYAGRDPRATADTDDLIVERHAFAWNPSAPGAKVEDTMLVGAAGIEVLTSDPRWPTVTHAGLARPTARPFD